MDQTDPITRILREGIQSNVFPGAVLFARHKGQIQFHQSIGLTSGLPDSPSVCIDTIYDLASLTKPLATVSSILLLIQEGRLGLSQPLGTLLIETKRFPLGQVSLQDLLSHQSGLPAWRPFYQSFTPVLFPEPKLVKKRNQVVLEMILNEPLVKSSLKINVYSDLGYIVLGFVVERITGQSLADFSQERIFALLQANKLFFNAQHVKEIPSTQIAPTEEDPWRGRLLQGEVHDENAAAIGGIAGHAGLFGTALAIGQVTKAWLDSYLGNSSIFRQDLVRQFVKAQYGTSWGLGWDTPSQPSSSGQCFSAESFGHLGFTGTSIWIDPIRELEVILLSNRVHPTRDNQTIKTFRPKLHDAIIREL